MKTLLVIAAAASLPLAAPAFAQSAASGHYEKRHPHAHYHLRVDRTAQPRYGSDDVYVREDRRWAPIVPVPSFAWRPEAEEEGVGADLVGPGSSMYDPTDQHDVSR